MAEAKDIVPIPLLELFPVMLQYLTVSLHASFTKLILYPVLLLVISLLIVNAFVVPIPPGLPSILKYLHPLKFIVPLKLLVVIETLLTPAAGRKVIVFVDVAPRLFGMFIGNVSPVLVYELCNSSTTLFENPLVCNAVIAAVMVAYVPGMVITPLSVPVKVVWLPKSALLIPPSVTAYTL